MATRRSHQSFDTDGQFYMTGPRGKIWNPNTGHVRSLNDGHGDELVITALCGDDRVATYSRDAVVKIWDIATGALCLTLELDTRISKMRFSADGTSLVTDKGKFDVSYDRSKPPEVRNATSYGVYVRDQWVLRDGERLLRLPDSYRLHILAQWDGNIVTQTEAGDLRHFKIAEYP